MSMSLSSLSPAAGRMPLPANDVQEANGRRLQEADPKQAKMREKFDTFVGETFYGQLLGQMRKTVDKAAYFNGGRAEEIFQGQLDQMISGEMAKASAHSFSGPMFELFSLSQK
jgi:peptidoglycan hydrolase FlgJ